MTLSTKLGFEQINQLPARRDYIDRRINQVYRQIIASNATLPAAERRPLIFMPNTVHSARVFNVPGEIDHKIFLFGVLPDGSKTSVMLDGIELYFDVLVPKSYLENVSGFTNFLKNFFMDHRANCLRIADVAMRRMHGFAEAKPVPYKRLFFRTMQDRKAAFNALPNHLETASDDMRDYFPLVARNYRFATADWNQFTEYEVLPATNNCDFCFRVMVADFKKLSKERRAAYMAPNHILAPVINNDPMLLMSWDIETYRSGTESRAPKVGDKDYNIFMISAVFTWYHSSQPLVRVCLVDYATNPHPNIDVIVECGSEMQILRAFIALLGRMRPDISTAFNGSSFDWPLVREKMQHYGLLGELQKALSTMPEGKGNWAFTNEAAARNCFRSESVKISATDRNKMDCVVLIPGLLDTDMMRIFMKLYPNSEVSWGASLNYFLERNDLGFKEDMPYKRLFKIYVRARQFAQKFNIPMAQEPVEHITPEIRAHCHCGNPCEICTTNNELDTGVSTEVSASVNSSASASASVNSSASADVGANGCCICTKYIKNLNDMALACNYCVMDSIKPIELSVKRSIVQEKRELSTLSYISLYDSFYRADQMKVENRVGARCAKINVAFTNATLRKADEDKDHFPGGFVFKPNKGLNNTSPITGMDFSSLYPSIMMALNMSPDMVVEDEAYAKRLEAAGYTLHHITPFTVNRGKKKGEASNQIYERQGWMVMHNGILNKGDERTIHHYEKVVTITTDVTRTFVTSCQGNSATESGGVITFDGEEDQEIDTTQIRDVAIDIEELHGEEAEYLRNLGNAPYKRSVAYRRVAGRNKLPGEELGIFPYILRKLFNKRKPIKEQKIKLQKQIEQLKIAGGHAQQIAALELEVARVDSKQNAIKVLSNTFYGAAGNFRCALYNLIVSAGITIAGQDNIKSVYAFTRKLGYCTEYGDTDSLYLTCPQKIYAEERQRYAAELRAICANYTGVANVPLPRNPAERDFKAARIELRERYWRALIEITMRQMSLLGEQINEYLIMRSNGEFLKMAYEEVGFPTVLCGKKKYFMTPHIESVNFNASPMIKGIDIIKKGQAEITRKLGYKFIDEVLSLQNEREMIDIIAEYIDEFYNASNDVGLYTQTAKYNTPKCDGRAPVITPPARFVERMRIMSQYQTDPQLAAMYAPPEAGDRFRYVVVQKDEQYAKNGNKIPLKKGDKMEYEHVFVHSLSTPEPMIIDYDFYMTNAIIGLFARFISYHKQFQPDLPIEDADAFSVRQATDYITGIASTKTRKADPRSVGLHYQRTYKYISRRFTRRICDKYGPDMYSIIKQPIAMDEFLKNAIAGCEQDQMPLVEATVTELLKTYNIFEINKNYFGGRTGKAIVAENHLIKRMCEIERELSGLFQLIGGRIVEIANGVAELVLAVRGAADNDEDDIDCAIEKIDNFTEQEVEKLRKIVRLSAQYVSYHNKRQWYKDLHQKLHLEIARITNASVVAPDSVKTTAAIKSMSRVESKKAAQLPDYAWA